jgi:uncharacterized surface protein with fasciclin (FAS1) repeats
MKKKVIILIILIVLLAALAGGAYWFWIKPKNQTNSVDNTTTSSSKDKPVVNKVIPAYIASQKNLSTFSKYLQDSELLSTLNGNGPFTVFIPNNTAFSNLDQPTESVVFNNTSNNKAQNNILAYHAVAGNLPSDQLSDGQKIKTVEDGEIIIQKDGSNIYVLDAKGNKAKVVTSDQKVSNGVVYTIDAVLLPQ